ncbi:MAG TPA: DUF4149 domain-containing protein [Acidobacteriaceae bacterium]|nr:DUF4149 domain-containing protein [Acidobacteriaceae bacterium]
MKLTFRALRLIALALWVGGIVFFLAVANVAFKSMPDTHLAGIIVRGSLIALHRIGLFAGAIYLFFTLALLATHDSHPVRAAEMALIISMMALTLYLQQSVLPHMETDRLTLGGDVQATSPDLPAHKHFDRLHTLSTRIEGAILLEGLVLLCLAPIHGHEFHRLG